MKLSAIFFNWFCKTKALFRNYWYFFYTVFSVYSHSSRCCLAASVPSPQHRSHQPALTLPSPQGLGHSITSQFRVLSGGTTSPIPSPTEPSPGQKEVFSFPLPPVLWSYTYRTCRKLIPPAIKQSASTTSCAAPVTPPKEPSSNGYLVTCFLLGSPHHRPAVATHQQQQTCR